MNSPSSSLVSCRHCGTKFVPQAAEREFCCGGCRYVYDYIQSEGLERFYDLKNNRVLGAVGTTVFNPVDWAWADALQERAEANGDRPQLELHLDGMSCAACAWLVERRFQQCPGALRVDVFPEEGRIRLFWEAGRDFSLSGFLNDLLKFGYQASDRVPESDGGERLVPRLGLCGAFALNTMAFTLPRYFGLEPGSDLGALCDLIALASATLSVLVGGGYFFKRAWLALRDRMLHIDFPIALGIGVAYAASLVSWFSKDSQLFYVDFVATFVFLMLLGRWMQERALSSARRKHLEAEVVREDHKNLAAGETFEVKAGEVVPVEARLLSEAASLSLDWINGEPEPVLRHVDQQVPAGARLLSREPVRLEASEDFTDSLLSQLLDQRGATSDPLLQRVLRVYLLLVLVLACLGAGWWIWQDSVLAGLRVFVSILVVSCPCALGVAIPLINARSARVLEGEGLFVRDFSLWNRLGKVRQLAFDKTGTLTLPVPQLINREALNPLSGQEREALAHLVAINRHPLARSLHEELGFEAQRSIQLKIEEIPGQGVCYRDSEGMEWSLGKPGWRGPAVRDADLVLARDGTLIAGFRFAEALRPGAEEEIAALRSSFQDWAILSGDQPERVAAVAEKVGIDPSKALGRLSPGDKAAWLKGNDAGRTLFIGDGANDSLAFNEALCSGTPANGAAILEGKADFYFLGKGLRALRMLMMTMQTRQRILAKVFLFAVLYNIAAVTLCLLGMMNPLLAAVLMPLSSLLVLALASTGWKAHSASETSAYSGEASSESNKARILLGSAGFTK